jgi:hypothetical protein
VSVPHVLKMPHKMTTNLACFIIFTQQPGGRSEEAKEANQAMQGGK